MVIIGISPVMRLHTTDNEHIESRVDRFQECLIMNHTGSTDTVIFNDSCLDGINIIIIKYDVIIKYSDDVMCTHE